MQCKQRALDFSKTREKLLLEKQSLDVERMDLIAEIERIAGSTTEDQDAVVEVPLGVWVEKNVERPELRTAVLNMAKAIYCQYPERASAGRILGFFAQRHSGQHAVHGFADDEQAGQRHGLRT